MPLRIGFGEYNITPPIGVTMAGYDKREGTANAVHDPLTARAMVVSDGTTSAALVVADLIGLRPEHTDRIGRLVQDWTGIPRGHVIAAGTHTHSGPDEPRGRWSGRASTNHRYADLLPDLVASAAVRAHGDLRPATLSAATAVTRGLTVNRRHPGGVTDPELSVVEVRRRGQTAGALLNFACHGVVMGPDNLALSADWIGSTRAALAERLPGAFPLVAVAPSGNINPLPRSIRKLMREKGPGFFTNDPFSGIYDRTGGTFAEARQMGSALARTAAGALERAEPLSAAAGVRVAAVRTDIGQGRAALPVRLRLVRMGQVVLLGIPGELFVETGLAIKSAVRDLGLFPVVSVHAPTMAYIPTAEAFAEGLEHDYEVDWARGLGMAPDAADRVLAAIRRGLRRLVR